MHNEHDITICADCKYHHNRQDGPRTSVWYNWFCTHPSVERQLGIDPVTGKHCYMIKNDLGKTVTTDEKHPNCCHINDGYCELYAT